MADECRVLRSYSMQLYLVHVAIGDGAALLALLLGTLSE